MSEFLGPKLNKNATIATLSQVAGKDAKNERIHERWLVEAYLGRGLALMDGNQGQGSERGIVTTRNLVVEIGRFTRGGFVTAD